MSGTVHPYDSSARREWDAFVYASPAAAIYHGTWWMDVMARCVPHENVSLFAREDDGHVSAVLPLFRIASWSGERLVSVPLRDQAGVLGSPAGTAALVREAVALASRTRCAYLVLKQGFPLEDDATIRRLGLLTLSHWITNEVTLGPNLASGVSDPALRNVRKAERCGLDVQVGTTRDMAERFYRLFVDTRRRLGIPTYSREFFLTLASFPDHVHFILCRRDDRDLAGAVILCSGRTAAYGYAANAMAGREYRAADLVVWKALCWASEHGMATFDFGADSPHQAELIRFKQKWGARPRTLHYYYGLGHARRIPVQDHTGPAWRWLRRGISVLPRRAFTAFSRWAVTRVD